MKNTALTRNTLPPLFLAVLVVQSSCGPSEPPGPTPEDLNAIGVVLYDSLRRTSSREEAERRQSVQAGVAIDREQYGTFVENEFKSVLHEPLSTFSVDVDRASYSNVRRFLMQGSLPPVDAVRIEEMVNYFPYDYTGPDVKSEHPFAVHAEVAEAPWQSNHQIVRIGLQTHRVETEGLPPNNLVLLLDVSGSMSPRNKLPLVISAVRMLVDEMRPEDRLAIVVYAGAAGVVLPSTRGDDPQTILAALERLSAGGSTAGGAGIELAYKIAESHFDVEGNNRVILATDGDFNVGITDDDALIRLIEEKRETGIFLTVLGVGEGNLQDHKMEQLADHGNGNYAYLDNILEARKVLVEEFGSTLFTVAKDVKIQVEFNPQLVRGYRLIGYENRMLLDRDFNDDTKDAGEVGAGHSVTALYEIIPVGAESPFAVMLTDELRYQSVMPSDAAFGDEIMNVKIRYKNPDGEESVLMTHPVSRSERAPSVDLRFQLAVAEFGLLLRNSAYRGEASIREVVEFARAGTGADLYGHRAEFVRLAEVAASLGLRAEEIGEGKN